MTRKQYVKDYLVPKIKELDKIISFGQVQLGKEDDEFVAGLVETFHEFCETVDQNLH